MPTQRFTDKVVFITGAAGGIGDATSLAIAAEGASLMLTGRPPKSGPDPLESLASDLRELGCTSRQ